MRLLCRGSGAPILFIHGIPTSRRLWDGITRRLCGKFTCYTLDLPGLGGEPAIRGGIGQLRKIAEQIEALRAEAGIEQWNLVGHDAGSAIAAYYAHSFPARVKRLALLSPALFPEIRPYFLFQLLRKRILGELLAPAVHTVIWRVAMRRACWGEDDDAQVAVTAFRLPFRGPLGPWHMMRVLRWGEPSEVLEQMPAMLSRLQPPTLIFHGANDTAIPVSFAHRTAGLVPNSKLAILEAGHFLPLNCPGIVAQSLEEFFANTETNADDGEAPEHYSMHRAASDSFTVGVSPAAI